MGCSVTIPKTWFRVPLDRRHALGTDGGKPDTEDPADEVLYRPSGADTGQHRKTEYSERKIFRWPEFIGHPRQQRGGKAQNNDREDAADGA